MSTVTHGDADASLDETVGLLRRSAAALDLGCNETGGYTSPASASNLLDAIECMLGRSARSTTAPRTTEPPG